MKKNLITLVVLWLLASVSYAADGDLFVYFKNGSLRVFPSSVVMSRAEKDGQLYITLVDGMRVIHSMDDIEAITETPPATELPHFVSFKFNNKYNDQVFTDVEGVINEDGSAVTAVVAGIGKRLTPSFKTEPEDAMVFVGKEVQSSKVSRHRFDKPVIYTIAPGDWKQMEYIKQSDEVWSEGIPAKVENEPVELTAEMFSTNAPSHKGEDPANMLDGNPRTFFHSTWGGGELPLEENPYLDIALPEELDQFSFEYLTRSDCGQRDPQAWCIYGCTDDEDWQLLATLDKEDGVPQTGLGAVYHSPTIIASHPVNKIRLEMTRAEYKNYLCLAELTLYRDVTVTPAKDPVLLKPAVYNCEWQPYGRQVEVSVDFLTDHATNVPRIDIDTECGRRPWDKYNYLDAHITIDGAGVFPDLDEDVLIRGRGNSSWQGENGKSPYRLKFAEKVKPFGLTKGKNWVLQANAQRNSMLANASAMKIAQRIGTAGANHVIPVELYMNGEYRGSYIFTEQVGLANNSVALEDETNAVRLELDQYNDDWQFYTDDFRLPTVVKDPDLEDFEDYKDRFSFIQDQWNKVVTCVQKNGAEYVRYIDPEMLARYLAVNEIVANGEILHPKSTFLYTEDIYSDDIPWIFGPVWDFDWGFGYQQNGNYGLVSPTMDFYTSMRDSGTPFFTALRYNSEDVKRCIYGVYKRFMENDYEEMQDFLDDYFAYAKPSLEHNAEVWGGEGKYYAGVCNNMKIWLAARAKHLFENLEVYDVGGDPIPSEQQVGDVNGDGFITMADVVAVVEYILGHLSTDFNFRQADADASGMVTIHDAVRIVRLVMQQTPFRARHILLPEADAALRAQNMEVCLGADAELPLIFTIGENRYTAMQFDVKLPEGFTLEGVSLQGGADSFSVTHAELPEGGYRVAFYNAAGKCMPVGQADIRLLVRADGASEGDFVASLTEVTLVTAQGDEERLPSTSARIRATDATGIMQLAGGQQQGSVYSIDGRYLGTQRANALPRGIYIVNGKKIVK